MRGYSICGGNKLQGSLRIQGAKNSALPILAATLLIKDKSIIHNCPQLSDVDAAIKILITLGCVCVRDEHTVIVDATDAANFEVSRALMHKMRSSIMFLGAMVSRMGKAVISNPGGCELGPRPIDMHLSALNRLGIKVSEQDDLLICTAPNGIRGADITLRFPSVGATENVIITAAVSKGTTVLRNAAKEPEISDLADFLNRAGAKISGAGSDTVTIEGVSRLCTVEHEVISDRIVAATYLSAAAVTGGCLELKGCPAYNMTSVLKFFSDIGCSIKAKNNSVFIRCGERLKSSTKTVTDVYPGFPTDAGPLILPVFTVIDGQNSLEETIFENRFRYVPELNKLGAEIIMKNQTAYCLKRQRLHGADLSCTDLRGGAALIIASLAAEGVSRVSEIHHIERGYYRLAQSLSGVGADLKEIEF
ncbi:MAG: UDP-N-acetylglucosamine 1-carboxyvinyltransferase [Clostridia bacterium]|nr:UDP-N-acetylglucosamine 1-carboxyvinyltransferase [Clostridia bacterium]